MLSGGHGKHFLLPEKERSGFCISPIDPATFLPCAARKIPRWRRWLSSLPPLLMAKCAITLVFVPIKQTTSLSFMYLAQASEGYVGYHHRVLRPADPGKIQSGQILYSPPPEFSGWHF